MVGPTVPVNNGLELGTGVVVAREGRASPLHSHNNNNHKNNYDNKNKNKWNNTHTNEKKK